MDVNYNFIIGYLSTFYIFLNSFFIIGTIYFNIRGFIIAKVKFNIGNFDFNVRGFNIGDFVENGN